MVKIGEHRFNLFNTTKVARGNEENSCVVHFVDGETVTLEGDDCTAFLTFYDNVSETIQPPAAPDEEIPGGPAPRADFDLGGPPDGPDEGPDPREEQG